MFRIFLLTNSRLLYNQMQKKKTELLDKQVNTHATLPNKLFKKKKLYLIKNHKYPPVIN